VTSRKNLARISSKRQTRRRSHRSTNPPGKSVTDLPPCVPHKAYAYYINIIMASGMGVRGTVGRCYGYFADFKQCKVSQTRRWSACVPCRRNESHGSVAAAAAAAAAAACSLFFLVCMPVRVTCCAAADRSGRCGTDSAIQSSCATTALHWSQPSLLLLLGAETTDRPTLHCARMQLTRAFRSGCDRPKGLSSNGWRLLADTPSQNV
jgi:hypothetical protein